MLHYLRRAEDMGKAIGVCLNCGGEDFSFRPEGRVLFSRLYENGMIRPEGTVIYEIGR